jgi:hypothetical protein
MMKKRNQEISRRLSLKVPLPNLPPMDPRMRSGIRPVYLTLTNRTCGWCKLGAYDYINKYYRFYRPPVYSLPVYHYWLPLYELKIEGMDQGDVVRSRIFKVVRFGIAWEVNNPKKPDHVVGRSKQTQALQMTWRPGSQNWKVDKFKAILVHRGAIYPRRDRSASAGCIEITGINEWENFNAAIRMLAGALDLEKIGNSGQLTITFQPARKPRIMDLRRVQVAP